MSVKEMTCIRCPMGCRLSVAYDGDNYTVTGNTCKRGEEYGIQELRRPMRVVTSSVRVKGGVRPVCAVKTAQPVPKSAVREILHAIAALQPEAPITIGQVLDDNIAGVGAALVATANNRSSSMKM